MQTLPFREVAAKPIQLRDRTLYIGTAAIPDDTLISGNNWQISAQSLTHHLHTHAAYYGEPMHIPTAAAIFDCTHELDALGHFLPLIHILDATQRKSFMTRLNALLHDSRLRINTSPHSVVGRLPLSARALIAGQMLMCFFYRDDVLESILNTNPAFVLFHSRSEYERGGGVGGGCYDPRPHHILLQISRLYEGFFCEIPEVCPLLHEFGHMLDGTCMRLMEYAECRGELPLLTPAQRAAFAQAKASEYAHYMAHYHGRATSAHHPLGHPYVFQTDGEFLAGYWELFWRNPHTMAQVCPQLFSAWRDYTQCDPRLALPRDYMGYVNGNRAFYGSGERPWPSSIRYHVG